MGQSVWKIVKGMAISSLLLSNFSFADVGNSGAAPSGNVFTFRIRGEPETLDWNLAHSLVEADLLMNLMEGLVTFNNESKIVPALANAWDVSADGKVYTFHLRPGVKWSDGVTLKAQDFVYSWKRLLSRVNAAPYAYFLFDIVGAEDFNKGEIQDFEQVGIKALDELTLQVKLQSPVAHWIQIPAFWVTFPLRQDVVEKNGNHWQAPGRIVTLGAYTLEAHDIDSKFVLRANPNYFGIPGNVDKIVALVVKDDAAALSLYETGAIDFLSDLALGDIKGRAGKPDLKTFPQFKTGFLSFVSNKYPVSNLKFRRAIAMAIDKTKIRDLFPGVQFPATSLVPPGMMGYSKEAGLPFNPSLAKVELIRSGVEVSGLTLQYLIPNWDRSLSVAEFVKSELRKNLGIEVAMHPMENKAYRVQLGFHANPLFDFSWTADYSDPDTFLSLFLSTSGNSATAWTNPVFDFLVMKARRSQSAVEREKLYNDLQKILLQDEAIIVPLYYEPNLVLIKPRVKNIELNSLGYLYLRRVSVGF